MEVRIQKVIIVDGQVYKTVNKGAKVVSEGIAERYAKPRYLDTLPRSAWDADLYWNDYKRIYNRALPRVKRALQNMVR